MNNYIYLKNETRNFIVLIISRILRFNTRLMVVFDICTKILPNSWQRISQATDRLAFDKYIQVHTQQMGPGHVIITLYLARFSTRFENGNTFHSIIDLTLSASRSQYTAHTYTVIGQTHQFREIILIERYNTTRFACPYIPSSISIWICKWPPGFNIYDRRSQTIYICQDVTATVCVHIYICV